MERNPPWQWFVLAAVGLLVVTMGASAAFAPSLDRSSDARGVLVGSQGGGPGLHKYGSVYQVNGSDVAWRETGADSVFEVERLENGSVVAAYANGGSEKCGPYDSPCGRTGYRIVDPDTENVQSSYSFPVRGITNSEVHAIEPLPGGGLAMVGMDRERLVVRENGSTVWTWKAASFYDAPSDPTQVDWLHMNDVDHLGSNRFLVSVRNANQLLVVERGEGVVQVINEDRTDGNDDACTSGGELSDYDGDGDVRCGDPTVLNHQHNPQWLGNGTVLVADSENNRVVELQRTDGRWRPTWAVDRAGRVELDWPRDADRLPNGNTLITDSLNKRVLEVDENGSVVWSISTDRVPYEADRIGVNDSATLPAHGDNTSLEESQESGVPVLSTLVFLAHSALPSLPFWFAELQMAVTLLAVLLLVGGGVQYYRHRE